MAKPVALGTDTAPARAAAGAAHDLRNMLFVVSAHAHRLMASADAGHPWREDLQAIQEASDRCSELAAQIVAEARILEQPARPLDINAIIRGVDPLLTQMMGDCVRLDMALSADAWPVTANTVQIEQIVMNLAINARDAMPMGGQLRIATENRSITGAVVGQPSHYVVLSVSDTGTGIDPAVQERMFEPYFTTKGAQGGTGVGLATVRSIALLHGGHIEVSTSIGRGTTFRVVLPRAPLPGVVRLPTIEEPQATRPTDLRILVIERDPSIREFLSDCLTVEGHHVALAANGAEALGLSRTCEAPLDLLITDLFLPDITGPDVATRLREQWPAAGVVFLSDGHDPIDDVPDNIPVLARPFTSTALTHALRRALSVSRAN